MSLEGRRTSGWPGTLEETRFMTLIFNEATQFRNVAVCTPASIIQQRSMAERISEPLDILFQHCAQCGSSQSHLSASNTLSYTTHNRYELIFELLGMRAGIYFSLVIIRPSKAMSHGCAAWGARRLSCDLLLYCNVGTIGGVKRKAHAAFATLAEQPCTVAQCLPDLC